jgi:hypothetical protein
MLHVYYIISISLYIPLLLLLLLVLLHAPYNVHMKQKGNEGEEIMYLLYCILYDYSELYRYNSVYEQYLVIFILRVCVVWVFMCE